MGAEREFAWPGAPRPDGTTISVREFRAVPDGQVYIPVLADCSRDLAWFTLFNADAGLLVGYLFAAADRPWIIDWQNQPRADSTVGMARGIEFGTSPFDESLRRSVERGTMLGAPTYGWIGARQRLSTAFTIVLAEIPPGFAGVEDVQMRDRRIAIRERRSGRDLIMAGGPS